LVCWIPPELSSMAVSVSTINPNRITFNSSTPTQQLRILSDSFRNHRVTSKCWALTSGSISETYHLLLTTWRFSVSLTCLKTMRCWNWHSKTTLSCSFLH
jgi:hypothetical protein